MKIYIVVVTAFFTNCTDLAIPLDPPLSLFRKFYPPASKERDLRDPNLMPVIFLCVSISTMRTII